MKPEEFEVKVIPISADVVPALSYPHTQEHIEGIAQAEAWGRAQLHGIVYYMAETQTVYAERCVCDMAGDNTACRVHHPLGRPEHQKKGGY